MTKSTQAIDYQNVPRPVAAMARDLPADHEIDWHSHPRFQVIYGTDVPFNWPVTVDLVLNATFLNDTEKTAILSTNLMKLLRIT